MGKITRTITIDQDVWEKAQELHLNISGEINSFLRKRTIPNIKDLGEELKVQCTQCLEHISEGFKCVERSLIICIKCQKDFDMKRCPHNARGEHEHIRWKGKLEHRPKWN